MVSLQRYSQIWKSFSPIKEDPLFSPFYCNSSPNNITLATVALLESGLISSVELAAVAFLYHEAIGTDTDTSLLLFLFMLYSELRQGSVRLEASSAESLANTYIRNFDIALSMFSTRYQGITVNKSIATRIIEFLGNSQKFCHESAKKFLSEWQQNKYNKLIGKGIEPLPIVASVEPAGCGFYFQKYYSAEQTIVNRLTNRFRNDEAQFDRSSVREILNYALQVNPPRKNGKPFELNERQKIALALCCRFRTIIISGGPGSGKTSVAAQIVRCLCALMKCGVDQVRIAAPTGRAAAKLQESIVDGLRDLGTPNGPGSINDLFLRLECLEGQTLHRLLRYQPSKASYQFNLENPIPAKLIIVDEVSMVDISMFARLLEAVSPQTHLVLLGDRCQLPSVDAGAVLGDLAANYSADATVSQKTLQWIQNVLPDGLSLKNIPIRENDGILTDHIVVLTQSHRSQRDIIDIASHINCGDADGALRLLAASGEILLPRISCCQIGLDAGPWPLTVSTAPQKSTSSGGCRFVRMADIPKEQKISPADLHSVLYSWILFYYVNQHSTSSQHSYLQLLNELCSAPDLFDSDTHSLRFFCGNTQTKSFLLLSELFSFLERVRILTMMRDGHFGADSINAFVCNSLRPLFDSHGSNELFNGMPLMIYANDYRRMLFNGDTGIVIKHQKKYYAVFRRVKGFEFFDVFSLGSAKPSFATTIHKAQGCEFDNVLIVLSQEQNRLVSRELLYTAITRARYFAAIFGAESIVRSCIEKQLERKSGIATLLHQSK